MIAIFLGFKTNVRVSMKPYYVCVMNLVSRLMPLQSSHTQSGSAVDKVDKKVDEETEPKQDEKEVDDENKKDSETNNDVQDSDKE